jgi:hypothetical protein
MPLSIVLFTSLWTRNFFGPMHLRWNVSHSFFSGSTWSQNLQFFFSAIKVKLLLFHSMYQRQTYLIIVETLLVGRLILSTREKKMALTILLSIVPALVYKSNYWSIRSKLHHFSYCPVLLSHKDSSLFRNVLSFTKHIMQP